MPRLSIRFLGRPEITYDDQPVAIERRKTLALLAYLAVSAKPCERELLTQLLWPEAPPARAPAYLRNALWLIKQTPVGEWLESPRDRIHLRSDRECWIDVIAFREHVRAGDGPLPKDASRAWPGAAQLKAAEKLYRGDFLTGFLIDGSVAFEEWQLRQEEALRRDLAESLAKLVTYHEARRDMRAAIGHARRWLELDPLDESAQSQLMLLYARTGQRAAALRLFERCERLLRDELGAPPGGRMLRLRQRILAGDSGEQAEPAARAPAPPARAVVPKPLTPFVGREHELAEISRILSGDECRLLALVGPGGTGKTRLALQVAHVHGNAFADGAVFVPLANVVSAEQVLPSVLAALRVPVSAQAVAPSASARMGRHALRDLLLEFLRGKRMLLVLDNVEHVISGIAWLAELAAAAPHVRVLLTSRVRPGIGNEWVLEVRGLPCPGATGNAADEQTFAAVQLFLEHARRARVGFEPDAAELSAMVDICRTLDGLPLGIELAAAWARTLSCQELVTEIRRSVDFLKDSPARVPERHRGLGAVFAQSWARLSAEEQRPFRRLSLFRGGFTRRAAEEIAGCTPAALTTLLDQSLLRRVSSDRYEMLEVVRQYAEEHLRAAPRECTAVRERFARFFLRALIGRRAGLQGERMVAALAESIADTDNLRQAWAAACEPPQLELLVPALIPYFLIHDASSRWPEGAQRFHEAVVALAKLSDPQGRLAYGFALIAEGWFLRESDWARAIALMRSGLRVLKPLAASLESTYALTLATVEELPVDRARVARRLRRTRAEQERLKDRWGLAFTLEVLSLAVEDPAERERLAMESLSLRHEIGDRWGEALAFNAAGLAAGANGEVERARERFVESITLRREMNMDPFGIASSLLALGSTLLEAGEGQDAERRFAECLELCRERGIRFMMVSAERGLGMAALQATRLKDAREHFENALAMMGFSPSPATLADVQGILANIELAEARPVEARERLSAGQTIDPGNPWVMLAAARLALADGFRVKACGLLRQALELNASHPARIFSRMECLLEAAEWLCRGDAEAEAFVVSGWLLRQPALSPAKRTRISRMLRRAASGVPREQRAAALAEGRELALPALVARILATPPFARRRRTR